MVSFDKALNYCVNCHPTLFNGKSFEDVKLKVMDHLLNTIGNGLEKEDFLSQFSYKDENKEYYKSIPEKYYNGIPLFYAYSKIHKTIKLSNGEFYKFPDVNSTIDGAFTEEELKSVEHAISIPVGIYDFHPYPNFQKKYSIIWDSPKIFNKDWLINIKWFYEKCLEYLSSDKIYEYSQAIPKDLDDLKWDKKVEEQVRFFNSTFERYRIGEESFEECISREYECEYTGDVKDFMVRRFLKENERRKNFCIETIEYISQLI